MLTRLQLLGNSLAKLRAAKAVTDKGDFDTATHLCGLAVELALKARICVDKTLTGWPENDAEFKNARPLKLRTHGLEALLGMTGQETNVKVRCINEWGVCLQWNIDTRYQPMGTAKRQSVEEMIRSAEAVIRELRSKPGLEAAVVSSTDEPFMKIWGLVQEMEIEKGKFRFFCLMPSARNTGIGGHCSIR
jgi:hypothetical protein